MTLRAVIENQDDIPEALRDEYVEKDGKFYLDLDDTIKTHTAMTPLTSSLAALRRDKTDLQAKLREANEKVSAMPEDFDAEAYLEMKDAYERLRADPNYKGDTDATTQRMKDQYETRIRNLETKHATEIAELTDARTGLQTRLDERILSDDLASAMDTVGVESKFRPAVRALLAKSIRVVDDEDSGERVAIVKTDMGDQSVKDFVANWSKSDDGKIYVAPPTGGGGRGSGDSRIENNPFSHDNWNATLQGKIVQEKGQEYADRLAKAAGTTVGGPRPAPRQRAA